MVSTVFDQFGRYYCTQYSRATTSSLRRGHPSRRHHRHLLALSVSTRRGALSAFLVRVSTSHRLGEPSHAGSVSTRSGTRQRGERTRRRRGDAGRRTDCRGLVG
uniref:Uncharacterized protein n=1 Tax=Cacopsylla melanoneura TaxID=428564 RepID=A0A8D8XXS1_9HEMI